MPSTAAQNAARFREVLSDGQWVAGTNYKAQLSGLSWQQATSKTGPFNTIAALTFHIHYYIAGMLQVFQGGPLAIRDKYSFNMPPVQSQQDWEQLLDKFWSDAEKFAALAGQMTDEKLQAVFVDEKYGSYQRNMDAMIEHCYYHLGQIVLLRKMLLPAD